MLFNILDQIIYTVSLSAYHILDGLYNAVTPCENRFHTKNINTLFLNIKTYLSWCLRSKNNKKLVGLRSRCLYTINFSIWFACIQNIYLLFLLYTLTQVSTCCIFYILSRGCRKCLKYDYSS